MKLASTQISVMFMVWSIAFAFCSDTAFSQDGPHLNANGDIQVVYPKRRDIVVKPNPGLLAECKCPRGTSLDVVRRR